MFVKFFKDRSNKKFINKALENRSPSVNSNKIQTVGIILNIGEFKDYDKLRDIFKNYGINENKIKFIAFLSENDTKLNHWDSYFESKDFGWNGLINNLDLQEFIEMEFDALEYFSELYSSVPRLNLTETSSEFKAFWYSLQLLIKIKIDMLYKSFFMCNLVVKIMNLLWIIKHT